ncbi:venom protein 302-like [Uloborus diversus]|uniref:venom protein 302-like n=1 Tax=Uloborus diversus TaxID=327109 RepID=UPI002409DB13|nr:venom protein 302-like [Uloborus diversus]
MTMLVSLLICVAILSAASTVKCTEEVSFDDDDDTELLCEGIDCEDYECPDTDECLHGTVQDVCRCCNVCAKGPGEQCGGFLNLAGLCTEGYYCHPHPKYPQHPGICAPQFV